MTDELERLEELDETTELDEISVLTEVASADDLAVSDVATSEDVDEFAELDEMASAGDVAILDELDVEITNGEAPVELDPPPEPPQAPSRAEAPIIIKAFIVFITRFSILIFMWVHNRHGLSVQATLKEY